MVAAPITSRPAIPSEPCSTPFQCSHDCRCSSAQCKAQRSILRYSRGVIDVSTAQVVTWRCLFCQHGRFEEPVWCHRVLCRMSPGVSGIGNSSLDFWFTGQAVQSNVWFGVRLERHTPIGRDEQPNGERFTVEEARIRGGRPKA